MWSISLLLDISLRERKLGVFTSSLGERVLVISLAGQSAVWDS